MSKYDRCKVITTEVMEERDKFYCNDSWLKNDDSVIGIKKCRKIWEERFFHWCMDYLNKNEKPKYPQHPQNPQNPPQNNNRRTEMI